MAITIESGSSDSRWNTAIFCGLPSSKIWKSSCFSDDTGAPPVLVTVENTLTNLTLTRMVAPASVSAAGWDCFCGGCGTAVATGLVASGGRGTVLCAVCVCAVSDTAASRHNRQPTPAIQLRLGLRPKIFREAIDIKFSKTRKRLL